MNKPALLVLTCCLAGMWFPASSADAQRQAEVARLGADVMPFRLDSTTHVFAKTPDGGVQQVLVKNPDDLEQVRRIRDHLGAIRSRFIAGDFSAPAHIHGQDMPGLAQLQSAKPGEIIVVYTELPLGGQLEYRTTSLQLVSALHQWFDAQVSDHGPDAHAGHHHMRGQ
ncbi:MAG: aspartate carbamoyltransferase [Ramlibacter sp.]